MLIVINYSSKTTYIERIYKLIFIIMILTKKLFSFLFHIYKYIFHNFYGI